MPQDEMEISQLDSAKLEETTLDHWLNAYRQMLKIRLFEEKTNELYTSAKMPGLAHLYIGEEAIAVGVCEALRQDDYITSTHRGHGHCLAKGAKLDKMFSELLGKVDGYCRGKGGSMHIADQDTGNLGANGIVGGSAGIATGAALSIKMRASDQVAVCFFGDGALGQGLFYESMNMAQLWNLPVIYVCENNLYGEYTPTSKSTSGNLLARAEAFGMDNVEINGQDVRLVYQTGQRLVERARAGEGPTFLLCRTYRFRGHHVGDIDRSYRSREEEEKWQTENDPLKILSDWLVSDKMVELDLFSQIEDEVRAEVEAAVTFALNASFPDEMEVDAHVYA